MSSYNIMPYHKIKVSGGYKIENKETGKRYSKKAMNNSNADKQLAILKKTEKSEKKKK